MSEDAVPVAALSVSIPSRLQPVVDQRAKPYPHQSTGCRQVELKTKSKR